MNNIEPYFENDEILLGILLLLFGNVKLASRYINVNIPINTAKISDVLKFFVKYSPGLIE